MVHLVFDLLDLYVDVVVLVNFVEIVFQVDLLVVHYQGDLASHPIDLVDLAAEDFDQVVLVLVLLFDLVHLDSLAVDMKAVAFATMVENLDLAPRSSLLEYQLDFVQSSYPV